MIGEIFLGKEAAEDLFLASATASIMTEKQAYELVGMIEKDAGGMDYIKGLWKGLAGAAGIASGALNKGVDAASKIPSMLLWTAGIGGGLGAAGASAYDVIKENLTENDPRAKLNSKLEAIFRNKKMELENSEWMSRVRKMRDELLRGSKKMTPDEYEKKYYALMDALDERSA